MIYMNDNYCQNCGTALINGVCPNCTQAQQQQITYQNNQYAQSYSQNAYSQGIQCQNCGTPLINGICPNCTNYQNQIIQNKNDTRFKRFFMNPKEKLVTTLGNTYIQNYLHSGMIRNGFAIVSDKRVYFQGKSYNIVYKGNGKPKAIKSTRSQIIDLKDVTGTGFKRTSNIGWLISAFIVPIIMFFLLTTIGLLTFRDYTYNYSTYGKETNGNDYSTLVLVLLLPLIFFIVAIAKYLISRLTLISIQFAGGEIAFDITWFSQKEIADFQRQLRLAKDKAIEEADNAVANKFTNAMNNLAYNQGQQVQSSTADELIKYGELLKNGIITQEEFDNFKRGLMQ